MTHYFFHICSATDRIEDQEGQDFDTLEAARIEACLAAREILAQDISKGQVDDTRLFEITDEQGRVVARVPFREAIN